MTKMRKYLAWFVPGDYQFVVNQKAFILKVDYGRYIHKIGIHPISNAFFIIPELSRACLQVQRKCDI